VAQAYEDGDLIFHSSDPVVQDLLERFKGRELNSLEGLRGDVGKHNAPHTYLSDSHYIRKHFKTEMMFKHYAKAGVLELHGRYRIVTGPEGEGEDRDATILIMRNKRVEKELELVGADCLVTFTGLPSADALMHSMGVKFDHAHKVVANRAYREYVMDFVDLDIVLTRLCFEIREGETNYFAPGTPVGKLIDKLERYTAERERKAAPVSGTFSIEKYIKDHPQKKNPLGGYLGSNRPPVKTPYGTVAVMGMGPFTITLSDTPAVVSHLSSSDIGRELLHTLKFDRAGTKASAQQLNDLVNLLKDGSK
jgi:hypothetical protein